MRHYDTINRIQDDGTLWGEEIAAFNKLDGQNLGVKYSPKRKEFGPFCSRNRVFDETDSQFGCAVQWFKSSRYPEILSKIVSENSGKGKYFNGIEEIMFYFEWYGENSFAGVHNPDDEQKLYLIDILRKKKGYIEYKPLMELFYSNPEILKPELIYRGPLTKDFAESIRRNDWTKEGCQYPSVKEGVVCRRTTIMKGQRLPKTKIKTQWWLNRVYEMYPKEVADKLI